MRSSGRKEQLNGGEETGRRWAGFVARRQGAVHVRDSDRGAECEARYLPAMELVDAGRVPGRFHIYSALSDF